jgi:hypothetical protein
VQLGASSASCQPSKKSRTLRISFPREPTHSAPPREMSTRRLKNTRLTRGGNVGILVEYL